MDVGCAGARCASLTIDAASGLGPFCGTKQILVVEMVMIFWNQKNIFFDSAIT